MTATGWTDLAVTFLLRSTESLPLSASPLYPSREEVLLFSVSAMTRNVQRGGGGENAEQPPKELRSPYIPQGMGDFETIHNPPFTY